MWSSKNVQVIDMVILTKHGFILINRHVIAKELIQFYAIFGVDACECPITSCYIDFVYNFVICKYKVTNLKNFNVKQVELKPELAKVNLKIRVYNND